MPGDFSSTHEGSSYTEVKTSINYYSDEHYIETGKNMNISSEFISDTLHQPLLNVRSFPEGNKNCYTLKPAEGKKERYLIRASFMYGNYDGKSQLPVFDLYLDVNFWGSVIFLNASDVVMEEIIHVATMDYIQVCLVNTGSGTPFISALELRPLIYSTYNVQSGSLLLFKRLDIGSTTNQQIRYEDDIYDRIWSPFPVTVWDKIKTSRHVEGTDDYMVPSTVMNTAARPLTGNNSMIIKLTPRDSNSKFHYFLYFAEIEQPQDNQLTRKFNITLNNDSLTNEPVIPLYQKTTAVKSIKPLVGNEIVLSISKTTDSTLPPILNAIEIYMVKQFEQSPTDSKDGMWYYRRNLSSSGLTGKIADSLANLLSIVSLDLSYNSLEGPVPEFLAQLPNLQHLNLTGNKLLTGPLPSNLIERSQNELELRPRTFGRLVFLGSIIGSILIFLLIPCNPTFKLVNTLRGTARGFIRDSVIHASSGLTFVLRRNVDANLCTKDICKKSKKIIIPVVLSITSVLVLLIALVVLWSLRKRRQQAAKTDVNEKNGSMVSNYSQFSYSEVVSITHDFQKVIGRGGFGTVYHGYLKDNTEVAVKMLSLSSTQGSKEFQTEAKLLMRVYHRNLASFVGYCNEGSNMALIYEYMANGNLEDYLTGEDALSWEKRLRIAVDAAQGLEYLHTGCKPPIVHRDVKTANILLDEKLQGKIADFGLSKVFPNESGTHVSTIVVGTTGYLDPEYYISNKLNEKSDVYSFGIVLLELITGLPAIIKKSSERIHIVQWVSPMLARGEIRNIVDHRLQSDFDINSVWKAIETAMACVPQTSIQRPTMNYVLSELKECLELEMAREKSSKVNIDQEIISIPSYGMASVDQEIEMGPSAR
ncbi:hypothetical protein HHK36_025584 [Tetracentron sinense]|uniref:non-specific serine/threonine protein kinase n=1 Tax=Tetracentron sinense TaxID=13715 RepID=A0A835D397_TETSI|nr:hypothetical protein HHK36_025584 [Tetracentron sinense]